MCQASQDGSDGGSGSWTLCRGALGGRETSVQLDSGENRLQVLVFYESDWDPSSLSLLTQFSLLKDKLLANNCSLYGCSTDTVATHLQWIKAELGCKLNFPLLSDPAGVLADKFSLFDSQERLCLRGVVVVDGKGDQLATVVSGLGEEDLARLTLNIVEQASKPNQHSQSKKVQFSGISLENQFQGMKKPLEQSGSQRPGLDTVDQFWSKITTIQSGGKEVNENKEIQKPRPSKKTWGPVGPKCPVCTKTVYAMNQVFAVDRKPFCKSCINCQTRGCRNQLYTRGIHRVRGLVICDMCHKQSIPRDFGPAAWRESEEDIKLREAKEKMEKKQRGMAMQELKDVVGSTGAPMKHSTGVKIAEVLKMDLDRDKVGSL